MIWLKKLALAFIMMFLFLLLACLLPGKQLL